MKYRKKPIVVEAIQFEDTPECLGKLSAFTGRELKVCYQLPVPCLTIETSTSIMKAIPGDYIVKDIKGESYLCPKDVFEETYETVE
jgi:hypothetical protein